MRNTKIALAVLALVASTAAMAEGVKIYGTLDAGLMNSNSAGAGSAVRATLRPVTAGLPDATNYAVKNSNRSVESGLISPNFLGFRASEDLDGGLKADVHVQTAYNAATGAGGFGFTQTDIGLSGDMGTARIGRTVDPMWAQGIAGFDAAGGSNIGSAVGPAIDMGITAVFPTNTVTYLSPNISGFSGAGQVRMAQKPGATTATNNYIGNGYSLTGNYAMGALSVGAGMSENKFENPADAQAALTGNSNAKNKGRFFGVGYDMGVAKVNLVFLQSDVEGNPTADATQVKSDAWGLNGSIPLGQVRLVGGYYAGNVKTRGVETANSTMYHLTSFYDLSKRTSLFANYQSVNNDAKYANVAGAGMMFGLNTGSAVRSATIGNATAFTVGVRHTF